MRRYTQTKLLGPYMERKWHSVGPLWGVSFKRSVRFDSNIARPYLLLFFHQLPSFIGILNLFISKQIVASFLDFVIDSNLLHLKLVIDFELMNNFPWNL